MRKLKGIELPVNMMVIVAIAVLIILGLVVILGQAVTGVDPITDFIVVGGACTRLNAPPGCAANNPATTPIDFDIDGDGQKGISDLGDDNLQAFCEKYKNVGADKTNDCKRVACNCNVPPSE